MHSWIGTTLWPVYFITSYFLVPLARMYAGSMDMPSKLMLFFLVSFNDWGNTFENKQAGVKETLRRIWHITHVVCHSFLKATSYLEGRSENTQKVRQMIYQFCTNKISGELFRWNNKVICDKGSSKKYGIYMRISTLAANFCKERWHLTSIYCFLCLFVSFKHLSISTIGMHHVYQTCK